MRKRSRYRPRELRNTLTLMQPVAPAAQTDVLLRKWSAINALTSGAGQREAWDSLAEAVNATQIAASMGYLSPNCWHIASGAEDALRTIAQRVVDGGPWTVTAGEEWRLLAALDIYSQAVELLPAAELLGAHRVAAERVAQMIGGHE